MAKTPTKPTIQPRPAHTPENCCGRCKQPGLVYKTDGSVRYYACRKCTLPDGAKICWKVRFVPARFPSQPPTD